MLTKRLPSPLAVRRTASSMVTTSQRLARNVSSNRSRNPASRWNSRLGRSAQAAEAAARWNVNRHPHVPFIHSSKRVNPMAWAAKAAAPDRIDDVRSAAPPVAGSKCGYRNVAEPASIATKPEFRLVGVLRACPWPSSLISHQASVTIAMKRGVAERRLRHTGALQEKADFVLVGHADA